MFQENNSDSSGIKLSNIALLFFYLWLHKLVTHIFSKKYCIKKIVAFYNMT